MATGNARMRTIVLAGVVDVASPIVFTSDTLADFTARNETAQEVVFDLRCQSGGDETWAIEPPVSEVCHCEARVKTMLLEIYTDNGDDEDNAGDSDDVLISDEIRDAGTHILFRDAVRYVEVVRFC